MARVAGLTFCPLPYFLQGTIAGSGKHYDNMPMQYTAIFTNVKHENFQLKTRVFFLFLLKT